MKIYIGADHAGFELKENLKKFLEKAGHVVVDCGAFSYNPDDDYPDFIIPVAKAVSESKAERGVVIGGSGEGEAITANRFKGVRASVYHGGNLDIPKVTREHNDSNILSLGARFLDEEEAEEAVKLWLDTPFSNEIHHIRRIEKINRIR